MRLVARFGLAFAPPPARWALGSPHRPTRRLIMQKARRHSYELRPLVSTRFQISFTPLVAVLFIVQSPYWFTIGHRVVFSLGGWTPHVQPGFHEPEFTRGLHDRGYRAFTF